MSFCCGASMLGTLGTLRHHRTLIHQVPLMYCPICQNVEVHPMIMDDFELLAEYAHADDAPEIYFNDYVDVDERQNLFANCISFEDKSGVQAIKAQIDHALDLLGVAKKMKDHEWEKDLLNRLKVLSERLRKHLKKELTKK